MSQLSQKCLAVVDVCVARVTRLDSVGAPSVGGGDDFYVTDQIRQLVLTADANDGDEVELLNGCGCPSVEYKKDPYLKRVKVQLEVALWEPGLQEILIGSSLILDGSPSPIPIGGNVLAGVACGAGAPNVAIEAWGKAIDYDAPDPDLPWTRFIVPWTKVRPADVTIGGGPTPHSMEGFSRTNSRWATGPYGDQVVNGGTISLDPQAAWAWFFDDNAPTAACGYKSFASS